MRWEQPASLYDCGLMLALGLQIYLAQLFFFEACRFAPASLVGPLEYSSVVWACILGFLIFADIPSWQVITGGALVIASGVVLAISLRRDARGPDGGLGQTRTIS
jgi:drug/metabolite transporter (DMT)-like permease